MKYQASNWTTWESVFYYRKKKETARRRKLSYIYTVHTESGRHRVSYAAVTEGKPADA